MFMKRKKRVLCLWSLQREEAGEDVLDLLHLGESQQHGFIILSSSDSTFLLTNPRSVVKTHDTHTTPTRLHSQQSLREKVCVLLVDEAVVQGKDDSLESGGHVGLRSVEFGHARCELGHLAVQRRHCRRLRLLFWVCGLVGESADT